MVAVMRFSRTGTIALITLLFLVGCKPPQDTGPSSDQPRVFPDPVAATPPLPVDVAGAMGLAGGTVGVLESNALEAVSAGGRCALDSVNGQETDVVEVSRTRPARFSGWAASLASRPGIAILLVGDANYALPTETLVNRPDVAEAISLPEGQVTDYQANADLRGAQPGSYSVHLLLDDGRNLVKCPLNRKVTLR